jgi:hypothetical protein
MLHRSMRRFYHARLGVSIEKKNYFYAIFPLKSALSAPIYNSWEGKNAKPDA